MTLTIMTLRIMTLIILIFCKAIKNETLNIA
jgi:hypothetical protein